MEPSVNGDCGSPWILVATPSSTVTSIAQVSGQSCGQATRTTSLMPSFYVEELDPVAHRCGGGALQVREAADVRGGNDIWRSSREGGELAAAQLPGNLRLEERMG